VIPAGSYRILVSTMKNPEYEKADQLFPDLKRSMKFEVPCELCRELGFGGTDVIWGNGPHDADIMVVGMDSAGEAPQERLWRASRITLIPLTNKKTGAKMRILLERAGLDPHQVFITNVVKCNVGYDMEPGYTFRKLAQQCRTHLKREIRNVRPGVVLTLGGEAKREVNRMVTESGEAPGGLDLRGSELLGEPFGGWFELGGEQHRATVFNLKHPSYVEGATREGDYTHNLLQIRRWLELGGDKQGG